MTDTAPSDFFVHPMGLCESTEVGPRTRVWAFAHVLAGARIGSDCNIGDHAFVEIGAQLGNNVTVKNGVLVWDGVTVEDDVFLGPAMVFTNDYAPRAFIKKGKDQLLSTTVRRGATIGANATIVCGVMIGEFAFVAAGAVVTRDVPPHALMAGNPATQKGWVCECGLRLTHEMVCACGKAYLLAANGEIVGAEGSPP